MTTSLVIRYLLFDNIRNVSITSLKYSWHKNLGKIIFFLFRQCCCFVWQNLICISKYISKRYCKIMHFKENFFRTSLTLWKSVHFCNESIIPTIAWSGSQKMLKNNIVKIFLFFNVVIITLYFLNIFLVCPIWLPLFFFVSLDM
jgi:hypothetical protein